MARYTSCSRSGATVTVSQIGLASSRRIAESVEIVDSAANAFLPVIISYSTTPNEKMSERWSTLLPCACSGDM